MPVEIKDRLPVVNQGEHHVPAVLLVDTSGSMSGGPIAELNQGLVQFYEALRQDDLALGRAEVSVISFNSSVQIELGFRPAEQYEAPVLSAGGLTAMNEGILKALDEIEMRKQLYRDQGVGHYRPWLFVLTDGCPTDSNLESQAMSALRSAIDNKKVTYMPMGIGASADLGHLKKYYPDNWPNKITLSASAKEFKDAFQWLSASLSVISHSNPQTQSTVNLPPTPSTLTIGI